MKDGESFYNIFFNSAKNIFILEPFKYFKDLQIYKGKISVRTSNDKLDFQVDIPEEYPLGEIKFVSPKLIGYPHQNVGDAEGNGGHLCLAVPDTPDLNQRLNLEVERLLNWLEKYYINKGTDQHYEYIPIRIPYPVTLVFDEDLYSNFNDRFDQKKSGVFEFSKLNSNGNNVISFIAKDLGNLYSKWSKNYHELKGIKGIWVYIEKEPIIQGKQRIENWDQLIPSLPNDFFDLLQIQAQNNIFRKSSIAFPNHFFLALGYKIPNDIGFELHWDLILMPYSFLKRKRKNDFKSYFLNISERIKWAQTINSTYNRFFGRGKLSDYFIYGRILIIGCGAVGSGLANSLVRGGIRYLDLIDGDIIEPGNICRSQFSFIKTKRKKTQTLKSNLIAISPYVVVNEKNNLPLVFKGSEKYEELTTALDQYDIIFDCTGNNQVLITLENVKSKPLTIHLSLTNKAAHLICTISNSSISQFERRNQMLIHLGEDSYPEFREGTGCWHPTFLATGANISSLINLALSKIDNYLKQNNPLASFFISRNDNSGQRIYEDIYFKQPELNLNLIINEECLEQIKDYSRLYYPNEFGGILLGFIDNMKKCAVVTSTIVPTKFKNTPTSFTPDINTLNSQLKESFTKYNGQLQYLGEWHSHPNGAKTPSNTDLKSLKKISDSNTVPINQPILLIAQITTKSFVPNLFIYNEKKLLELKNQSV